MVDHHLASMTPRIVVLGLGGAGSNAVSRMATAGIRGVDLIALNTDQQALGRATAHKRIRLGERLTGGRGTGGDPSLGSLSAQESAADIALALGQGVTPLHRSVTSNITSMP